jgi:hypothetical protein
MERKLIPRKWQGSVQSKSEAFLNKSWHVNFYSGEFSQPRPTVKLVCRLRVFIQYIPSYTPYHPSQPTDVPRCGDTDPLIMGERRGAYRVLVGKPTGKRPAGRVRRSRKNNIRMDFNKLRLRNFLSWNVPENENLGQTWKELRASVYNLTNFRRKKK